MYKKDEFFLIPATIDECNDESNSDSDDSISPEDQDDQVNGLHSCDDDENNEDEIEEDNVVDLIPQATNIRLQTMKDVRDTINPDLNNSYVSVNIDEKGKYLHKNIAISHLTDEKHRLPSNRFSHVMEN